MINWSILNSICPLLRSKRSYLVIMGLLLSNNKYTAKNAIGYAKMIILFNATSGKTMLMNSYH
jgi:hypothetical protein